MCVGCSQLTESDLTSIIEEVDGDGSGTLDFDGKNKVCFTQMACKQFNPLVPDRTLKYEFIFLTLQPNSAVSLYVVHHLLQIKYTERGKTELLYLV